VAVRAVPGRPGGGRGPDTHRHPRQSEHTASQEPGAPHVGGEEADIAIVHAKWDRLRPARFALAQRPRVQTYGELIDGYEYHPEAKFADALGQPCGKQTIGLLQRRHVRIGELTNIGKESNRLEEVQAGLEHDDANVYTEYHDPRRNRWNTTVWPAVKRASLATLERMCKGRLSRRALINIRAGRSTPHRRNQEFLESVVKDSMLT